MVRSRIVRSAASSSGPSSSSSGPLSTSSCRLRVPTTGARATPSCSPTSAEHASGRRPAASRRRAAAGAASTVSRQPRRPQAHSLAVGVDDDVADLAGAPSGGRAAARPRAPARRRHRCRPGAASGRRRRRRRTCARRGRRCWRRWRRRPGRRTPRRRPCGQRGVVSSRGWARRRPCRRRRRRRGCRRRCRAPAGRQRDQLARRGRARARRRPRPRRPSSGSSRRAWTSPARLSTAPTRCRSVGGEVDADDVARPRRPGRPASGGLPTRPCDRRAELLEQPLGDQLADQVGDGHPGQPAGAGQVGAAGRAVAEQQLEQQRPVVAAGVLRQELAARGAAPGEPGWRSSSHLLVSVTY